MQELEVGGVEEEGQGRGWLRAPAAGFGEDMRITAGTPGVQDRGCTCNQVFVADDFFQPGKRPSGGGAAAEGE